MLRNCRGSLPEALAYAASLALWQRRMTGLLDAAIVAQRVRARAPGGARRAAAGETHVLPHPVRALRASARRAADGRDALFAGRLEPEKGLGVAIEACRIAGIPLVVAGEGSERARFEGARRRDASRARSTTAGSPRCAPGARVALVPSLTGETFGLAAAEAMAAGVPVAASEIGALPELVPRRMARAGRRRGVRWRGTIAALRGRPARRRRARWRRRSPLLDPARLAATLAAIY